MEKRVKRTNVPDDLPRSPSGRVPKWVIEEAAGRAVDPEPWRAPGSPLPDVKQPRRARRRRRGFWGWMTALVAVALIAGMVGAYLA